jgi:hypothetical protein
VSERERLFREWSARLAEDADAYTLTWDELNTLVRGLVRLPDERRLPHCWDCHAAVANKGKRWWCARCGRYVIARWTPAFVPSRPSPHPLPPNQGGHPPPGASCTPDPELTEVGREMVICEGRPEPHQRGYLCLDPVTAPHPLPAPEAKEDGT